MSDPEARERAVAIWQDAYRLQMAGDLDAAAARYRESIAACATAEAHTFLGWTLSFQGHLDAAIAECLRAIEVDPDFGNPYNDIGCYLVEQGESEDAIGWFEKAKKAPRYEPRHFPYLNLGRLRAARGEIAEALQEFEGALAESPGDPIALRFLDELRYRVN